MSKIVSIHSFRGGTGKSNTTANLAAQVAMTGRRVAIIDTDIQSPGIHVLFGLGDQHGHPTLNEYLRGEHTIEEVTFSIGDHAGEAIGRKQLAGKNLWLVPSSIDGFEISRILRDGYDVNRLNEGLYTIREALDLDYLFVDTHPGVNDETLLSIAISDILILIMRPDQQDFQGTIVTVDVANTLEVPAIYLVVNKVLSKYDFDQIKSDIETIYETPVAGVLPLSEEMVDLASSDIFSLCYPEHPWSRGIKKVAQQIMEGE